MSAAPSRLPEWGAQRQRHLEDDYHSEQYDGHAGGDLQEVLATLMTMLPIFCPDSAYS